MDPSSSQPPASGPPRSPSVVRKRAAEHAADHLREAILSGELAPGTDLPAERELSERLGVSRLTLRSALARLEAEGLVRPVHGSGTRVLDFRTHGGIELIAHLVRQSLVGGRVPLAVLRDLLEFRRIVAVELFGLATVRASEEELHALRAQREEQGRVLDDPQRFMQADLHFARLVVRAGHNLALELVFNTIQRMIEGHAELELLFHRNAAQTIAVYDRLLDLMEARDPQRVKAMASRLLDRLDRTTLEHVAETASQHPDTVHEGAG